MFRAELKKDGIVKNSGEFSTMEQVESFFSKFRLVSVQAQESDVRRFGYDPDNMPPDIPFFEIPGVLGIGTIKMYTLPPEGERFVTDISSEILERDQLAESTESFLLANKLKAYIRTLNKKKLRDGTWDNATFVSFLTSPIIANAERSLNQASWSTYKGLVIQASAFYTAEEMAYIIGRVEAHEQKWQSVLGG